MLVSTPNEGSIPHGGAGMQPCHRDFALRRLCPWYRATSEPNRAGFRFGVGKRRGGSDDAFILREIGMIQYTLTSAGGTNASPHPPCRCCPIAGILGT